MFKKKNLKNVIIIILLAISILFGLNYYKAKNETKIDNKLIQNRIENVKELTSLKYSYTNMGQFKNQINFMAMIFLLPKRNL